MTDDSRLKKSSGESRASRELTESREVTQNRELTDAERLEMFRLSVYQNRLPDLPKIPGYHVCWLTTNNPGDDLNTRLRLGYELIKADEVPGWEHITLRSGDYAGFVGVNEMVGAKIRVELYDLYFKESHVNRPRQLDGKMQEARDQIEHATGNQGLTQIVDPEPVYE